MDVFPVLWSPRNTTLYLLRGATWGSAVGDPTPSDRVDREGAAAEGGGRAPPLPLSPADAMARPGGRRGGRWVRARAARKPHIARERRRRWARDTAQLCPLHCARSGTRGALVMQQLFADPSTQCLMSLCAFVVVFLWRACTATTKGRPCKLTAVGGPHPHGPNRDPPLGV